MELDAKRAREAGECFEGRIVLARFEACDGGLLHSELSSERDLGEIVLDAIFDEARGDGTRDRGSVPLCSNVRLLELTCDHLVARAHLSSFAQAAPHADRAAAAAIEDHLLAGARDERAMDGEGVLLTGATRRLPPAQAVEPERGFEPLTCSLRVRLA